MIYDKNEKKVKKKLDISKKHVIVKKA